MSTNSWIALLKYLRVNIGAPVEIGDGAGDFESVEKGVIKRKSTEWVRFGRQLPSILLPQKNPKSATYKLFSSIFLLIFTPARPQSRMNACGSHLP